MKMLYPIELRQNLHKRESWICCPVVKVFILCFLFLYNSAFAVISCFSVGSTSEEDVQKSLSAYKTECLNYGGGGSVWLGNYVKVSSCTGANGVVVEDSNGVWQVDVSCNTCYSEELKKEVSDFKETCQKQCKTTEYQCSYTLGEWGGSMNALPKVCGATDSTLEGCKSEESSSSALSSESSGDGSSSSGDGGEGSSSSYGYGGSSSSGGTGDGDGSSSSGSGTCTGDYCGTGEGDGGGFNLKCCGLGTTDGLASTHNLKYFGDLESVVYCYANRAVVNIPLVEVSSGMSCVPYASDGDCDYNATAISVPTEYYCYYMPGAVSDKGCKAYSLSEVNSDVYVSYSSSGGFSYYLANVTGNVVLPSNAPSVSELLSMSMKVRVSDYPSDTIFSSLADGFSACGISVSSSSSETETESSSSGGSDCGSSSGTSGWNSFSASEIEASSSSKKDTFESEVFIAGENQIYSPEQVFCDGLQNMEFGKCYSLNPERGIQYGWINNNAQDPWWWVEVPCDGSVPVIETTSAGCQKNSRGPESIYLPEECFYEGLDNMEAGKCYALNPERGIQYGWINNNAQDSWWWVEVSCETDIPDSDDEFVCPENSIFFKRNDHLEDLEDSINIFDGSVIVLYDALGRKQKSLDVFEKKKAIYARKVNRNENRALNETFKNWNISFKTVSGYVEAKTELGFKQINFDCSSRAKTIIVVNLYMRTPKDSIHKVVNSDDERLLAHENRHVEIYLKEGNDDWIGKISVKHGSLTKRNACNTVKKAFWPVVEKRYRKMLKMQNAWDDEDKNNISHARHNIDSLVALQKKKWNEQSCLKENSK